MHPEGRVTDRDGLAARNESVWIGPLRDPFILENRGPLCPLDVFPRHPLQTQEAGHETLIAPAAA